MPTQHNFIRRPGPRFSPFPETLPAPTVKEEQEICYNIRNGINVEYWTRVLLASYSGFALSFVNMRYGYMQKVDKDDLVVGAAAGLYQAALAYKPDKGTRYITIAWFYVRRNVRVAVDALKSQFDTKSNLAKTRIDVVGDSPEDSEIFDDTDLCIKEENERREELAHLIIEAFDDPTSKITKAERDVLSCIYGLIPSNRRPDDRDVLYYKEAAYRLGMPVSTVQRSLMSAKSKMKVYFSEMPYILEEV